MEAILNIKDIELIDLRAMFYMVYPRESTFQFLSDVPNYVDKALPFCIILIILEAVVLKLKGYGGPRLNDSINSISHGLLSQLDGLVTRPVELITYVWVYNNYCLVELAWDSAWTWFLAFIAMDFTYYWFHRIGHESNIMWAAHQVHHSSEEFNLLTALRQSAFQKYLNMVLNLGMAFFLPPPMYYVHVQFNLLYQFWIHTEMVNSLGPLEYILNTPSHHRVHHGRNPAYIDKNYAGTLIIWDRIFGTFQAEDEKAIYGIVPPIKFWNPIKGQVHHYLAIFSRMRDQTSVGHMLYVAIKGPGWRPGQGWTGLPGNVPRIRRPVVKYNSSLPAWANVYVFVHFMVMVIGYGMLAPYKATLTAFYSLACIFFFILSISCFGALFDNSKFAYVSECFRCSLFLVYCYYLRGPELLQMDMFSGLFVFFAASAILWVIQTCLQYKSYVDEVIHRMD